MNIRTVVPEDAEMLASLRIQMRKERETVAAPADAEAFFNANADYFRTYIADGSYQGVVIEENGKAVACGGICLHNHPPSYSVPNGRSACLLNMYTIPEYRGRGAAGKILAFLVGKAGELGCCKVFLNASDMGKPLYQKFGFKEVSGEMVFDLRSDSAGR